MAEMRRNNRERWNYDVFLSFRGADVRNRFVSVLNVSLVRSGIYTFKDDVELRGGKQISMGLTKAIDNSKIHLVILSSGYASSSWCLNELLHIMQCCKGDTGHMVLPIFYDVTPSDVRHLKRSYGQSFDKHKSREANNQVEDWTNALNQISNISGFCNDKYSSDASLIDDVIRKILAWLPRSYLNLPKYAVGIRPRARRIYELMRFDLDDALIVGVWGMGGIGKTTLAKAAYNEFSDRFEGTCFLENFGENSKKPEGKAHLQQKLLSDILETDDIDFKNKDHQVKNRFRNKRVLVVIDDVNKLTEYNSIAIDLSCFGPGSRIFVTSRNKHLLEQLEVENIYSPEALNYDESLELVSLHAFRAKEPHEGFLQLSEELVDHCGGLPLAMEVLGALLYKRSISLWKDTLELLRQRSHADIKTKLQIGFDSLSTEQKDIFLDISCFFIGMDKDYVSCILDGCKFYPQLGLTELADRCLITVSDNRLLIHDLLRDMGRQIIRETSPKKCEKWSRLWESDDVIDVMTKKSGTDAIEGLSLKAEVTAVENLEVEAFSNLGKLRLLQLSHVSLNGSYEHFPKCLRWFCWFEFPLDSLPTNLHLEYLVVMDMQYSNLKQLWDDREVKPPFLKKLKYLYLSHSVQLTDTPDFSYLPNLEKLLLIGCKSLVRVHNSIGTLELKLVLLNLKDCTELRDLPLELYTLKSLETLILSGCSQLERLNYAIGEMKSLETLKVDYTGLTEVPSSINQLKNLEELSFDGCKELWSTRDYAHSDESPQVALPFSLSLNGLSCLKTLSLGYCNLTDELVPENLGSLSCLQKLDLRGNNFRDLQTDFAGLLSLQVLKLDDCLELLSMFSLPKTLTSFGAANCIKLQKTPDLSECSVLESLYLTNCINLDATPGLDKLKRVGVIHMEMCNSIPNTYRERIMQGLTVGANGRIIIPGSDLPNWVSFKNKTHSISFTVPENLNLDLVGFTLSTPYKSEQDNEMSKYSPNIIVNNRTKGVVCRRIAADQILMYREKHIWQGHFSNEDFFLETGEDFFLETGDEVDVSVNFGDQVSILETGLTLSYKDRVTDIPDEQFTHTEQEVDDKLVDKKTKLPLAGIWGLETFFGRVWSITGIRCYLVGLCAATATIAAIKVKRIRRKMLRWIIVCLKFLRLLGFK